MLAALVLSGCGAPTTSDITAVLDQIGAPPGFVQNPARTEIQDIPVYVRRAYDGTGSFGSVREAMIQRLKAAGFANATWRNGGAQEAPGIIASARGIFVFVRVDQPGDDPIDIEAYPE